MGLFSKKQPSPGVAESVPAQTDSLGLGDVNLRIINRVLLVVAVLLLAAVLYVYYSLQAAAPEASLSPVADGTLKVTATMTTFKPESFYVRQARERNIFKLTALEQAANGGVGALSGPEQIDMRLQELQQLLSVVGVAWEDPGMVMIHDRQSGLTYFLREGESIGKTGARITRITRTEVRIGIEDKEKTLQ
jgi:hypothetical protein